MLVARIYETGMSAQGGRDGTARSIDGDFMLRLTTPPALGGAAGTGTNPEQLLAAAYAASFLSALHFVASEGGASVPPDAGIVATVAIGPLSQGGFGFDIRLEISLPGLGTDDAATLVQRADRVCPFSNALRGNVTVQVALR